MRKFKVEIEEYLSRIIEVEAKTQEEAVMMVKNV